MERWWIYSFFPGRCLLTFLSQILSQADMQAMGGTITMVTQEGTTITIPAHEAMLSSGGAHSVTMVSADGTEGQVSFVTLRNSPQKKRKFCHSLVLMYQTCMNSFYLWKKMIFWRMLAVNYHFRIPLHFCQYYGSQWDPKLFGYQHSSKYHIYFSTEEITAYRFVMTWGWVKYIFFFWGGWLSL